jgi:hypothetical protein
MKALIRLYVDNIEVYAYDRLSPQQVVDLKNAIDEWVQIHMKDAYCSFNYSYEGALFKVDSEFLYKHGNKKININPMNILYDIKVLFEFAGDDDWVCSCHEVDCPGGCGVLRCGCIDVCRCARYYNY